MVYACADELIEMGMAYISHLLKLNEEKKYIERTEWKKMNKEIYNEGINVRKK